MVVVEGAASGAEALLPRRRAQVRDSTRSRAGARAGTIRGGESPACGGGRSGRKSAMLEASDDGRDGSRRRRNRPATAPTQAARVRLGGERGR
jgi:hypothetical protein